ncbi:Alpha/beta hydrolase-3 [Melia azedarach]|uniref:Alpha/beta hydrolase-3 n=1 Tax=Melia azedarach TaxID=155640 RepID=A0ACC1XZI7_MELAZ|nr:Alpha/beta hydrolase-3 [Melia azedarach]
MQMESIDDEVTHNFPPFFKVYKNGTVKRYVNMEPSLPGLDPDTGVQSKDVMVSSDKGLKARIFLPMIDGPDQKLPLLVHYHGGGFCLGSALDLPFKRFLTSLVAEANIMAITIDYRLAPEHLLPTAHLDSWTGLQWVASHSNGQGPEPWINERADFGRVLLAGESAGANIAHYVAVQAGVNGLAGLNITGTLIVHPYFGRQEPDKLYEYMCPTSSGFEKDPILNPAADPNLKSLKSSRIFVCVAEKDSLRNRGVYYYETMKKSEWQGNVEFYETLGEDHCFHMFTPHSENVGPLMKKLVDFIKTV